uniref:RUN and TBC1 domain-containing protein 3 n=1 Tax=Phallusia mammillata TaxID=59560 RepID=A0A6F9DST0_9ASCI|nr:small G protein signaling modulator 3 homolog [Phallusia mammillata]
MELPETSQSCVSLGIPFSAVTESMRPKNIIENLQRVDESFDQPEYRYDEFGFRVEEEDGAEPESSKILGMPWAENHQHELQWQAYIEFTLNSQVEDMTWDKIGSTLPHSEKLNQLVRSGIPHSMRAQIWTRLSGAIQKKHSSKISYDEMTKASLNSNHGAIAKAIEKDLLRTIPTNACFSNIDSPGIPKLRRILQNIAWLYPDNGYCQGTGMIASHLLLFMEEEDVFWTMCAIIEDLLPLSYFGTSLFGVHADQRVLRQLIVQFLPAIDTILQEHDIELSLISLHWFITIFAGVLHTKILLRVWDHFFMDGSIVLFQIAIGMLKLKEEKLICLENSAEIFNTLSDIPSEIDDIDLLLTTSYKIAGSLTTVVLNTHREKHQAYLLAKHGKHVVADHQIPRKQMVRRRSFIGKLFSGSAIDENFENLKAKNIKQTELVSELKNSITHITRHFCKLEKFPDLNLNPDYSPESHVIDHDEYMNVSRQRRQRARALLDFERNDDDELGFKKNDIITIISMKDEHCWVGEQNGLQGWFPAKFVELLDERSKTYSAAGDGNVNDSITDLVRGGLCPALSAIFEHGLRRPVFLGSACHAWQFIEEAASHEVEKDFDSVFSRLVLCKTFRLDEDGKVLTPEELLYRCVQAVNLSHNNAHAQMDVKFRTLICYGLNEQVLHLWLEVLCSCLPVVKKWYHPWSFLLSPGWVQIKCELRLLSKFTFYLPPDSELPKTKELSAKKSSTGSNESLKEGVRDMLVKHHLFSWDL